MNRLGLLRFPPPVCVECPQFLLEVEGDCVALLSRSNQTFVALHLHPQALQRREILPALRLNLRR